MHPSPRQLVRLAAVALLLAFVPALAGCSSLLGDEPPRKRPSEAPPSRPTAAKPPPPPPAALGLARLARRLSLDLLQRLPSVADVELLADDPSQLARMIDGFLAQPEAARAIAALHPRMWRLSPRRLPGLGALADAGDADAAAALGDAILRDEIVDEPATMVRTLLEAGLPFPALFTRGVTTVTPSTLALWGLGDGGEAWPGESYRIGLYADDRPAVGLLGAHGFLAAFSLRDDATARRRTSAMLRTLACLRTETVVAHDFMELTEEEMAGDLLALAATKSPCAGCHNHAAQAAPALAGLGAGDTLAAWRAYAAPADAAGSYAGDPFEDLAGLGRLVGGDPRVHRCAIERLATVLMQRPFNERDKGPVALALTRFNAAGFDLKLAVRELLLSPEYAVAPIAKTKDPTAVRNASGVRFLRRHHWRGVLRQLSPATADLAVPDALEPGGDELESEFYAPSGGYLKAADALARRAAAAIVATELTDGVPATARRVLTALPDGVGHEAGATVVQEQILTLWRRLSSEELADSSALAQGYFALWAATVNDDTPEAFKNGWRTLLVAMLTHPTFMTY